MDKLLVICGPTATGKTQLAIEMAKKFGGEIVSADSRQVYQNMDIGTGKFLDKSKVNPPAGGQKSPPKADPPLEEKLQVKNKKLEIGFYLINGIKIWLYDVVKPDYRFSVADYKECTDLVVNDILKRGKLPILVGGTGLYIKAVVDGIETIGVPPDWELRKRLLNCSIVELLNLLRRLDSKRAEQLNDSDRNNPRRLVRAIEVASIMQKSKCKSQKYNSKFKINKLFIGLKTDFEYLYKKIDKRVEERLKNGAIDEIKKLLALGYNFKNSVLGTTIGYREWQAYFESKSTTDEVINKWKFAEHAYSRRQLTWFKKDKRINWFDISENDWEIKVEKSVEKWLCKMIG